MEAGLLPEGGQRRQIRPRRPGEQREQVEQGKEAGAERGRSPRRPDAVSEREAGTSDRVAGGPRRGTLRVCLLLYFLPNLFRHQGFSVRSRSFVECHRDVVRLLIM